MGSSGTAQEEVLFPRDQEKVLFPGDKLRLWLKGREWMHYSSWHQRERVRNKDIFMNVQATGMNGLNLMMTIIIH